MRKSIWVIYLLLFFISLTIFNQSNIINEQNIKICQNEVRNRNYSVKNNKSLEPNFNVMLSSTVKVYNKLSQGTGFIFKIDKQFLYILTARHLIDLENKIRLDVIDVKTKKRIKIKNINKANIYIDNQVDMAIIKVPKPKGSFIRLKLSQKLPTIGTRVYTVGHPLDADYIVNTGIVSTYITATLYNKCKKYMLISAPTFGGNSGGACVNNNSEVVGIIVAVTNHHTVLAVTITHIKRFIKELGI